MNAKYQHLQAVILDWAGTTIDYGSRAPASVFLAIFQHSGVPISEVEARGPMGKAKREHIAAVLALPRVAEAWEKQFGRAPQTNDVDRLYAEFLPLQQATLAQHCDLIPGALEALEACRARGLKIGSTTGYTRGLMDIVEPLARDAGYAPEVVLCADDTPQGRPAPWMLFRAAEALNVYPMSRVVVVDDTPVGIEAGVNAGAWSVGVTTTGNCLGLSLAEVNALSPTDLAQRKQEASQTLKSAGAHFVIDSVADLVPVLDEIENQLLGALLTPP
ncbi:MAG TPA: phosphonoacetaldehyde hydrolase, partial [Pirellulaceae bacterium]|nr:phosphonoacetaldehyde hydrolase [Pirellulaceae bacterium]